jgi:hypothetical protein
MAHCWELIGDLSKNASSLYQIKIEKSGSSQNLGLTNVQILNTIIVHKLNALDSTLEKVLFDKWKSKTSISFV